MGGADRAVELLKKESYNAVGAADGGMVNIETGKEKYALMYILKVLNENAVPYGKITSHEPTLNDVFLSITGKELRDNA